MNESLESPFAGNIDEKKVNDSQKGIKAAASDIIDTVLDNPAEIAKSLASGLSFGIGITGMVTAIVGVGLCMFIALGGLMGTGPLMTLFLITITSFVMMGIGTALEGV